MSLKIKKQFPEFDINEYTNEKELTIDEVITEINTFDWTNESLKSSKIIEEHAEPSIWLRSDLDDTLSICWTDNNKFTIYYSVNKLFKRSCTSIVNGQEQVIELVKLFNNQERHLLLSRLEASEYHLKTLWLLDIMSLFTPKAKTRTSREVIQENYTYEIKYLTILKKLTFSIVFLLLPVIVWVVPSSTGSKPFNWTAFMPFQGFCTLFALPAIIITINHFKRNGDWKVYFRKGDNTFFIISATGKQMFDKGEFVKRIITTNESNAPWSNYEYTTLVKNNGQQLHFSNLLLPSSDIDKLFGRIEEIREKSGFQIIKNKKIEE